jgi:arylsulfatase A
MAFRLLPTLLGHADEQKKHEYLYWEFYEKGGRIAVRLGDYKGVRMNVIKNPDAPIELYKVTEDLEEQHDIAADHPDDRCQDREDHARGAYAVGGDEVTS